MCCRGECRSGKSRPSRTGEHINGGATYFTLWGGVHNWQNGSNESFNGKLRDECLAMQWFKSRIDAKILIEEFRRQFNEVRPHSSLGQLTPAEFKQKLATTTPGKAVFQVR
jgi:IS30 family transposase